MGFIEGLSGYRDFRRRDEKPMLTAPHGRRFPFRPGLQTSWRGPAQESSPLRQHLLVARSA
ncbi:hypothetical protein DMI70_21790 [Escherichia coli]|nr:hypothetical protein [Escherichia coli]